MSEADLEALIAEWESEIAEFATHNDPYYNGVRQCISDLKAVLAENDPAVDPSALPPSGG